MTVESLYILIPVMCQIFKVFPAVQQEQGSVLHKIYISGFFRFFDLKAQNIPVKPDHFPHVIHQQSKSIQSHYTISPCSFSFSLLLIRVFLFLYYHSLSIVLSDLSHFRNQFV